MHESLARVIKLSDTDLLSEVGQLVASERQATVRLIASLAELDSRRLYLGAGCSSLFTYCTQVLHLSEHAAYGRIEAARAARRFPLILDLLADGSINLTAIGLLAAHLTTDNHLDLLNTARHKSKRDIEHVIARLRPQAEVRSTVRKLPQAKTLEEVVKQPVAATRDTLLLDVDEDGTSSRLACPSPKPKVVPLAPERYKVQMTVSGETYDKLCRVQNLLRHVIPGGDPAAIFDRALTLLLADLMRTKLAASDRPRAARQAAPTSRHVPAAVKREVWERDEGRCAFVGTSGRCREAGFLEFHHVVPYADGGPAVVDNVQLRCRAHNAYESEQYFGPLFVREGPPIFAGCSTGSGH